MTICVRYDVVLCLIVRLLTYRLYSNFVCGTRTAWHPTIPGITVPILRVSVACVLLCSWSPSFILFITWMRVRVGHEISGSYEVSYERLLYKYMMEDYNPAVRPVRNDQDSLQLIVNLHVYLFEDLVCEHSMGPVGRVPSKIGSRENNTTWSPQL